MFKDELMSREPSRERRRRPKASFFSDIMVGSSRTNRPDVSRAKFFCVSCLILFVYGGATCTRVVCECDRSSGVKGEAEKSVCALVYAKKEQFHIRPSGLSPGRIVRTRDAIQHNVMGNIVGDRESKGDFWGRPVQSGRFDLDTALI